jgi:4-hydroxy-tetrahydrodipicolinate synthase
MMSMFEDLIQKIKGINAINITPFDATNRVDYTELASNLDFLIGKGIEAIYPCGNTGEFYALSRDEAKEVVRFTVGHADGRAKIIAGVGYDVETAIELAQNASSTGADGLMIHQPVNPFLLADGILEYYRRIARSTSLPILLYVRHESITDEVLAAAAEEPNIIGVKYAVNHLPSFSKAVQRIGSRLVWICGTAEMWAPFYFAAGAEGFTSGMVNVDTARSFALLHAMRSGDYPEAMRLWNELRPFEELREGNRSGNNVSVVKEAMRQLGLGNGRVRPPIAELKPEERRKVREILIQWGLLKADTDPASPQWSEPREGAG